MVRDLLSDADLVRRAAGGDLDSFDRLARRHGERLHRVAYRILGNRQDAEDAVQETLVRAWRSLGSFRADSSVSTWLQRICVNRCLSMSAQRHRHQELSDDVVDLRATPEVAAEQALDATIVRDALVDLPEDQRVAVVLCDFAGFSYSEVADITGVSLTAARSRLFRGRLSLTGALRGVLDPSRQVRANG